MKRGMGCEAHGCLTLAMHCRKAALILPLMACIVFACLDSASYAYVCFLVGFAMLTFNHRERGFGLETNDVDLSQPIDALLFAEIEQTFYRGQVLVLLPQFRAPRHYWRGRNRTARRRSVFWDRRVTTPSPTAV